MLAIPDSAQMQAGMGKIGCTHGHIADDLANSGQTRLVVQLLKAVKATVVFSMPLREANRVHRAIWCIYRDGKSLAQEDREWGILEPKLFSTLPEASYRSAKLLSNLPPAHQWIQLLFSRAPRNWLPINHGHVDGL